MITISWSDQETTPGAAGGDTLNTTLTSLVCDIITSQQRDVSVSLPEHPVEEGAAITDHRVPQPRRTAIEVKVGDAVANELFISGAYRRNVVLYPKSTAMVLGVDSDKSRTADVLETLSGLCEAGTVVDVAGTLHGDLEGYQIESVSAPHDTTMGRGTLTATVSLRKRRTVSLTEVEAPAPLVERARPSTERGSQATTTEGGSATTTQDASAHSRASTLYGMLPNALRRSS